jgi:hypothetical protein
MSPASQNEMYSVPGNNVCNQYYIGGKTLLVCKLIAEGFHWSQIHALFDKFSI